MQVRLNPVTHNMLLCVNVIYCKLCKWMQRKTLVKTLNFILLYEWAVLETKYKVLRLTCCFNHPGPDLKAPFKHLYLHFYWKVWGWYDLLMFLKIVYYAYLGQKQ